MDLNNIIQRFMEEEQVSSNRHISSEVDRKYAVTKAYHDLMLRTIRGHTSSVQNNCIRWLADHIEEFVNKEFVTEDDYRIEHEKLCNGFLDMFNSQLKEAGASQQSFGKAQKAVNMTIKYLYCFCDRNDFECLFKYAHMPLDNSTLNWCKSNSLLPTKNCVWSNLDKKEYYKIAKNISNFLTVGQTYDETALPGSPLEADFIIWAGEKRKAALKELKSVLKKSSKNPDLIHCITIIDKKEMREYFEIIMQDREE